jgi:hypothetical protein
MDWPHSFLDLWWDQVPEDAAFIMAMVSRKQERMDPQSQYPLQEHASNDLTSSHEAPPLKVFKTSQQFHGLGTKNFNAWAFGGHLSKP